MNSGVTLFGLIQTDAPITRGSSGGALINSNGELIGITKDRQKNTAGTLFGLEQRSSIRF